MINILGIQSIIKTAQGACYMGDSISTQLSTTLHLHPTCQYLTYYPKINMGKGLMQLYSPIATKGIDKSGVRNIDT